MLASLGLSIATGCRETLYDIVTRERLVRVPSLGGREFVVETGPIELPASLGEDKVVDSATLDLTAVNRNARNGVAVAISVADSRSPNAFGAVASFDLAAAETREIRVVQREPGDALVRASQSEAINIRFESRSARDGIGEIEFRFTVRVLAHKDTPGSGPGIFLFY